MFDFTVQTG